MSCEKTSGKSVYDLKYLIIRDGPSRKSYPCFFRIHESIEATEDFDGLSWASRHSTGVSKR